MLKIRSFQPCFETMTPEIPRYEDYSGCSGETPPLTPSDFRLELLVQSHEESRYGRLRSYPQLEAAAGLTRVSGKGRRHLH
jgi:hypothetical protein